MSQDSGRPADSPLEAMRWNLDAMSLRPADLHPPQDIRDMIRSTDSLPALPETARRLLDLMEDPDADAVGLAAIMDADPLLAAQAISWANSAYYGLKRPVESVHEAVIRVLGFEQAAGLALGITTMGPLETPREGIVGRDAVWRHAMHAGHLMSALRDLMPEALRPSVGFTYLAGLTQNIGYLLLGHLLPSQFAFLNRLLSKNPEIRLHVADNFALGVDHTQLGHWLLETWGMPMALQSAVRHHHNPAYIGAQQPLVLLTCLSDQLLSRTASGLGPKTDIDESEDLIRRLDIDPGECTRTLEQITPTTP